MKKFNRRSKQQTTIADSSPSLDDNKQDLAKTVHDLQQQNDAYKREIEELRNKMNTVTSTSDDGAQKLKESYLQKLTALEEQVVELKKKLNAQNQLSTQKHRQDTAAKNFHGEIQRLKTQKVQLQCKMKLDSVQFRLHKASLEKEVLQLKKEQRRNQHEIHKLSALNQMLKLVLQRKTTAASMATKRLQELLESRKALSRRRAGSRGGNCLGNQDNRRELEATLQVQEVCAEYERQMEEMVNEVNKLKVEAEMLEEDNSRVLSQDEDIACRVKDSELRDLKEEVASLGRLVSQTGMPKPQHIHKVQSQLDLVQSSASVGSTSSSLVWKTPESELSVGITGATETLPSEGSCCSCSKKSLCKTTKCGCRVAGGSCGTSCGCSASKCTNREVPNSVQLEKSENSMNSAGVEMEKRGVNSLDEKPAEVINNCRQGKKPLCNIKNTMANSIAGGHPGQKKRVQTGCTTRFLDHSLLP